MERLTDHTDLVEELDLVLQESEEVVVHHCEDIAGMDVVVEESQGRDIPDSDSFAWDSSDRTSATITHLSLLKSVNPQGIAHIQQIHSQQPVELVLGEAHPPPPKQYSTSKHHFSSYC